jgi:hypothetical protein
MISRSSLVWAFAHLRPAVVAVSLVARIPRLAGAQSAGGMLSRRFQK